MRVLLEKKYQTKTKNTTNDEKIRKLEILLQPK
jgi:hypothetical protein